MERPIISYDFDGVLHKSVLGIHPISFYDHTKWTPFLEMHDLLRQDAIHADIVVVTARPNDVVGNNAIMAFLKKYDLPVTKVYYTDNKSKREILEEIKAVCHYDDSIVTIYRDLKYSSCKGIIVNRYDYE